ncbi:hypothetical protein EDC04DRAFT_2790245, partial [Pisolithus marmoratus]
MGEIQRISLLDCNCNTCRLCRTLRTECMFSCGNFYAACFFIPACYCYPSQSSSINQCKPTPVPSPAVFALICANIASCLPFATCYFCCTPLLASYCHNRDVAETNLSITKSKITTLL